MNIYYSLANSMHAMCVKKSRKRKLQLLFISNHQKVMTLMLPSSFDFNFSFFRLESSSFHHWMRLYAYRVFASIESVSLWKLFFVASQNLITFDHVSVFAKTCFQDRCHSSLLIFFKSMLNMFRNTHTLLAIKATRLMQPVRQKQFYAIEWFICWLFFLKCNK